MLMTMSMVMHGWGMPMMMVVARMIVAVGIVHFLLVSVSR